MNWQELISDVLMFIFTVALISHWVGEIRNDIKHWGHR